MEYLVRFNCVQNKIIGITYQYLEQFDCVQINEYS